MRIRIMTTVQIQSVAAFLLATAALANAGRLAGDEASDSLAQMPAYAAERPDDAEILQRLSEEPDKTLAVKKLKLLRAMRNPWNEVEWGSHYSRSMASYGVFTAVCGFEYHGPRGYLAFSPRITPEDFRAAFTSAKGWGTFSQKRADDSQTETIDVKHGELRLQTLAFDLPVGVKANDIQVVVGEKTIVVTFEQRENRVVIMTCGPVDVLQGERLQATISYSSHE